MHPLLSISLLAMNCYELLLVTPIGSPKWITKMDQNGVSMGFQWALSFPGDFQVYLQPVLGAPRFRQRLYGEHGEVMEGGWAEMGCPAELQVLVLPCNNDFPRDLISAVKNGDELQAGDDEKDWKTDENSGIQGSKVKSKVQFSQPVRISEMGLHLHTEKEWMSWSLG